MSTSKTGHAEKKYASIAGWNELTSMGRTSTYNALGRGDLKAIKVGARVLIDVEAGLAWLAQRPPAAINVGRRVIA